MFPLSIVARRSATATLRSGGAVRFLNVHEYISMELLKDHGVPTPEAYVASTASEAENIYMSKFNNKPDEPLRDVVIKAQVLSGGRGEGKFKNGFQGGVHTVTQPGQARELAMSMLGEVLVTGQAPNGILCNKVLLMERIDEIRREMYVSIVMDRRSQGPVLIASPNNNGGGSIREIIANHPEQIFMEPIDVMDGLEHDTCVRMAAHLGLDNNAVSEEKTIALLKSMYDMFVSRDCLQIEVNPLVETPSGDMIVCNATVNFDDNAAYRQPQLFLQRDKTQQDPREVKASKYGLNYIGLDGNIGCMVNGAGLAMATMDLIQLNGGSPANFLDVGGGANVEQVQEAFEILNSDPQVEVMLVNIFGGLTRCDVIAMGIITAAKEIGLNKTLVIRLQGTNVEEANVLIEASPFKMIVAKDFEDAAIKAVAVADLAAQARKLSVNVKFEGFEM